MDQSPRVEPGTGGPRRDDHAQRRRGARPAARPRTHRRRTRRNQPTATNPPATNPPATNPPATNPPPTTRRRRHRRRRRRSPRPPRPSDHTEVPTMTQRRNVVGHADRAGDRQLPDRAPSARRPCRAHAGGDQAARRSGQRRARRGRRRCCGGERDRRRGDPDRAWRARRCVPGRRLPDRLRHVDEHERQRGHRPPRVGRSWAVRSTRTITSTRRSRRTTSSRRRSAWP